MGRMWISIPPVPQLLSDFSGGRLQQPRRVCQIVPHLSFRHERFATATGGCVMIGS
ncbi:hypothetical protein RBA03_05830 [Mycobacteroides abscessus subsp. massiliense]|nr:hypothetical protein [Mycobacteroides abscessus]EIU09669.1 hypothetical protein MA5S0304_3583 [Mycobacteroides abscessus 5S-0304]EIU22323.1 hypothetical protein MA5S0708_3508 [Mycobacteroides abscessus 5S-0708]EIU25469.1 hypothetical protein MA5S0817_3129 [Mycobacteroides abscessus 5S-0817]EIU43995.1 hypothetical protein MA5S1215_3535 [Mycobacteroides abscessus 5S-1215]EIU88162.1 hypothetical protein MA5S0921_4537 [Mycobacteroides abscessus 5S-0921]